MSAGNTTFFAPACHCTRTIECATCRPRESIWNSPKKSMVCMLPSCARTAVVLALERGLRDGDQQRDEFRGRRIPGRLELVHDQQPVGVMASSDEVVRARILRGRELG